MNSLERITEFQNLIKKCEEEKQWIGVGNPLAPILIVGKEPAIDLQQGEDEQIHIMNTQTEPFLLCSYCSRWKLKDFRLFLLKFRK